MIYSFQCQTCNNKFEIRKSIKEISEYKPICISCGSENTYRDYQADNVNFIGPQRTLGSYADRKKKSLEEKSHILNKNKDKSNKLPENMTRYERDSSGNIKV